MQDADEHDRAYLFLSGGGKMAALIEAHPWETTPLGPLETWPQSLRFILSLCLNSPMPTAIRWGDDLRMLYNDAFAPMMTDSHPQALGVPTAAIWPAFWQTVSAPYHQAMSSGKGFTRIAVDVWMMRDGKMALTYWDFTITPIRGEDGRVEGLLSQGAEITERLLADRAARESSERLEQTLSAGDGVGTWDWDVAANRVRSDPRFAHLYGVPLEMAQQGAPIEDFFRRIHPDDASRVYAAIGRALATGGIFSEEYRLVDDDHRIQWVLAQGQCERDEDGRPIRFPGVSFDITTRKRAEERQSALLVLSDRFHDLTDPADLVLAACAVLSDVLGASRVGYGLVDKNAETVTIEREWHLPGVDPIDGVIHLRTYGDHIDDLKQMVTVAIADVDADERTQGRAEQLKARNVRAFVNMPLVEHGEIVALLYATEYHPRVWSSDELLLMREVGERLRTATERLRTEEALRISDRDLHIALEAGHFGTWKLDMATGALQTTAMCRLAFGRDPDAPFSYAQLQASVHPDDRALRQETLEACMASGEDYSIEYRIIAPNGEVRWIAVRAEVAYDAQGMPRRMTGVTNDITARKELESALSALNTDLEKRVEERTDELLKAQEALRQSQKMEAVGQLTGGIAHDFNNLLQGITGSLRIAQRRIAQGRADEIGRFLSDAVTSASRAAALTHRLLAFSRRQPLNPRTVRVNYLIASLEELFRRTIGENIALVVAPGSGLWASLCDPNQLENALLNLVINARDAMPGGGRLTFATRNVHVDAADGAARDVGPGDYISIAVTDTGVGMSPETVARAFEPFFTTKPSDRGTGLGLSMVYGFARQSDGHVTIDSAPGQGSTVTLYLPRHLLGHDLEPVAPVTNPPVPENHGETILVIEDEAIVRGLIVEALEDLGYVALQAPDGMEGLDVLRSRHDIDLLITDIGLPGMNGCSVADAARTARPTLKILFVTGYAENAAIATGFLDSNMALLNKPFDMDTLGTRVRELIMAPADAKPNAPS